jgi:transcriptional regulator with XRE-family HTH domain
MFSNTEISTALLSLGGRLRQARIAKGDGQAVFARRIGVSVPTLRDLEQGNPRVSVGTWGAALWALSRLPDLDTVLQPQESLFEQFARQPVARQRAPRRTKTAKAPTP